MPWDPDVDWSTIRLAGYWPHRKRIDLQNYLEMRHEVQSKGLMKPINIADLLPSRGFARGTTKSNQNLKAAYNNGAAGSPTSERPPPMPPLSNSSSLQTFTQEGPPPETGFEQPKRFLSDKYAKCSVKGNFLTLAAQPKNVDLGEWLAHQCKVAPIKHAQVLTLVVVEMNRLLAGMLQVVQEVDTNTGMALCNEVTCPTMSAGRSVVHQLV
jgi:hypothetical protein